MKINLIAIGTKMPAWIQAGFKEYQKRLPREYQLNLIEIAAQQRTKNSNIKNITIEEGKQLLSKVPKNNRIIALEVTGKQWNTEQLANSLQAWHDENIDISLLIGGPDGLSEECLQSADFKWSLSHLTFPHMLVRVILAEQIYRAWSITSNHPYHRK